MGRFKPESPSHSFLDAGLMPGAAVGMVETEQVVLLGNLPPFP